MAKTLEDFGWAFREQPTSDFGIDAQAEKRGSDGTGEGRLIALQVKSGKSYFRTRGEDYVYYGEARHLDYWLRHSLPVFIILYHPDTELMLWQKIDRHLITAGKNGAWSISIPAAQTLDAKSMDYISDNVAMDIASIRRHRLALNLPMMRRIDEHDVCYVHIEEWVNKTLNFRNTTIVFGDDPEGSETERLNTWLPAYTVEVFMFVHFPWLEWTQHEHLNADEHGAGEVATWILEVKLSEVGRSAVTLDDYYLREAPPDQPHWMSGEEDF